MTQTEKNLLNRWIVNRDPDALARIASEHSAMVYHTCLRVLRNAADAEDVAQDCFLSLLSGRVRIRHSLGGWLHTLATHRSLDYARSAKRRQSRESQYGTRVTEPPDPDWPDIKSYVDKGIAQLPDKLHEALVLHFLEGRTYDAIAVDLGLPRSTVASRVQTAVERVREYLRKQGLQVPSVLPALLATQANLPVPAALSAALAKLAIAGAGAAAASTTLFTGATAKISAAAAAFAAIALFSFYFSGDFYSGRAGSTDVHVTEPSLAQRGTNSASREGIAAQSEISADIAPAGGDKTNSRKAKTAASAIDSASKKLLAAANKADARKKKLAASIVGYVLDEKSLAFPDASIRIEVMDILRNSSVIESFDAKTDSAGLFAVVDIRSFGNVNVYASAKGYLTQKQYALQLAPGSNLDVGFTLVPGEFFVAGTVEDQDGKPVEGAEIQLRREQNMNNIYSLGQTISDPDGKFEISVEREGSCDFAVLKEGFGAGFFPNIQTGTEDAKFVLCGPGAIAGRVTLPNGNPVPGARVEVVGEAFPMGAAPGEGGQPMQVEPAVSVTNEEGEYLAEGLGQDYVYTVQLKQAGGSSSPTIDATAPQIFQLAQNVFGSAHLGQYRSVRVKSGETTDDIDFVVQPVACITGKVMDAATGAPAYHVALLTTANGRRYFDSDEAAWTWTETDGSYTLQVPLTAPATVEIFLLYMSSLGKAWNGEESPLGTVEASPGAVVRRDFTIEAPCAAPVLVTDGNGMPVAGAGLRLEDVDDRGSSGGLQSTDAGGRYTVYGIPPNRSFRILAVSSAYGETTTVLGSSEVLSGAPGETLPETNIVVGTKGGVEGIAIDASGAPIAGAGLCIKATAAGQSTPPALATTDVDGSFTAGRVFPSGDYMELEIACSDRGIVERASIPNIQIVPDGIIELGPITLTPVATKPRVGTQ